MQEVEGSKPEGLRFLGDDGSVDGRDVLRVGQGAPSVPYSVILLTLPELEVEGVVCHAGVHSEHPAHFLVVVVVKSPACFLVSYLSSQ